MQTQTLAVRGLVSALASLMARPSLMTMRSQALHTSPRALGHAAHDSSSSSSSVQDLKLTPKLEERLQKIAARAEDLGEQLSKGGTTVGGFSNVAALTREYGALRDVADKFQLLMAARKELSELHTLMKDPDPALAALAAEEKDSLSSKVRSLETSLLEGLLPGREDDERDAIVEVRAGTGGAEASLFAADLMGMYRGFAGAQGWSFEMLEASLSEAGGYRTASSSVCGPGAYGKLRWEAGVHRVQRVPATETMGRVHTSTATVVVLPQVDDVEMSIRDEDLVVEAYRSSGAGGQHVNVTSSAVRITHIPTGTVVTCQDERSQLRNRAQAMKVLRARLYEAQRAKAAAAVDAERRSQAGTAERNERIRTYNFAQNRVTDHRVGITHHGLEDIMSGAAPEVLDEVHAALGAAERADQLADLVGSS